MNHREVDRILIEWEAVRDRTVDADLQAIEAALFLEDTFDVVVSDNDIDHLTLGTLGDLRAVLALHRGR